MPKISVIMPAYNHGRYIGEAIQSVRNQTFADWELIVVDDGSTDDTAQIVGAIVDPRVSYIWQSNRGCPAALNTGFHQARGVFVSVLASDDLLLPEALLELHRALDEQPEADVVYGDGYVIDENSAIVGELAPYRRIPFGDTLDSMVISSPVVGVHSAMMRRQMLEYLDGPFDEQMLGYEDWDLFVRLKAGGARFKYVPKHVCCYRFHGANKSAPLSTQSERRKQALVRKRMKEINAPWFDSLSLSAKQAFFEDFLTISLQGDRTVQKQVMAHPSFRDLPARVRSALLYRLTTSNLLGSGASVEDRQTLLASIRLDPIRPKAYPLLGLLLVGHRLPERALAGWHAARAGSTPSDPVTQILRTKNVA